MGVLTICQSRQILAPSIIIGHIQAQRMLKCLAQVCKNDLEVFVQVLSVPAATGEHPVLNFNCRVSRWVSES